MTFARGISMLALLLVMTADLHSSESVLIVPRAIGTPPTVVAENLPIEPNTRYALHWMMKIEGEKRWRFRADFSGVSLLFSDGEGKSVQSINVPTSCWQTVGWRPAWFQFRTPMDAAFVSVSFEIRTSEALPGRFHVRDLSLQNLDAPLEPAVDHGVLLMRVLDEKGICTPARIYVRNAAGQTYTPPLAFAFELGGGCFYLQDPEEGRLELPVGKYEIEVMKGFEYGVERVHATVSSGELCLAELNLKRRFTPRESGWFSGDHHTHLFRHGGSLYPMMNVKDVYRIAKAEGLAFLPFMGKDQVPSEGRIREEPSFIGMMTEELTRDLWGHICPLGVTQWPDTVQYGNVWPMNFDWTEMAMKLSGAVACAHPYGPLRRGNEMANIADPDSGLIARELPIDLALGQPCTVDVLAKEDASGDFELKIRDLMRLLNLGFHVGFSGSTDFHLDQGRQPIGGIRTYAQVSDLTWPNVAEAYNQGRTFASNGPILLLTARGRGPGESLSLSQDDFVECEVDARSLWGIDSVELWLNGALAATLRARDGAVEETVRIRIPRSGWILAIARGRPIDTVMMAPEGKPMVAGQYAITSPIYLKIDECPAAVDREAAEYYVRWVDAVETAFNIECERMVNAGETLPQAERDMVMDRLGRSREVFLRKAKGE